MNPITIPTQRIHGGIHGQANPRECQWNRTGEQDDLQDKEVHRE